MSDYERFDEWYWSYKYGSKLACIKAVKDSDLSAEEQKIRIDYHTKNLGVTKPRSGVTLQDS